MALDQEGGLKVLSGSSVDEVEQKTLKFLSGDGTVDKPRKVITQSPQLVISGGVFYIILAYRLAAGRDK